MAKKKSASRAKVSRRAMTKSHAKILKGAKKHPKSKSGFDKAVVKHASGSSRRVKAFLSNTAVTEFMLSLAGENAGKVLGTMEGTMSDEEIARTAKLKVSDVRSVLNKLHGHRIAVYERTRDKDTGWYYYKWSLNADAIAELLDEKKKGDREEAARLAAEGAYSFYTCGKCTQEKYQFETALDYLFKCPQCGSALDYVDAKAAASLQKK